MKLMTIEEKYPDYRNLLDFYIKRGMAGKTGFGKNPALIVVDMAAGWTMSESLVGSDLEAALEGVLRILQAARATDPKIPIIFTTTAYDPHLNDVTESYLKVGPAFRKFVLGSKWVQLEPRLNRQENEPLLVKKVSSAFFATNLLAMLVSRNIDTLVITGCSTSGCVRATAGDACNYGFNAIVPFEAVGDRNPEAAKWALIDIDDEFGDVVRLDETLSYLAKYK